MAAVGAHDDKRSAPRGARRGPQPDSGLGNDEDALDDDGLTDDDLESEIELVSELVLAATSSDGPLHQDEVDLLLGVTPRGPVPPKPKK
jgi:hypothetical protein